METAYPVLLADMPNPRLRVYARETAIAEKVEAMVTLGLGNSRMKDFFDIWYLAQTFEFDQATLGEAIRATFARRQTPLPDHTPVALTTTFAEAPAKAAQWRASIGRSRPVGTAPELAEVVAVVVALLKPILIGDGEKPGSAPPCATSPETTHRYLEADLKMMERALASLQEPPSRTLRYRASDRLFAFLDGLLTMRTTSAAPSRQSRLVRDDSA